MPQSDRHALPYLVLGQAQKEFFHNEALARIDMILCAAVEGHAAAPPAGPAPGEGWLVDDNATGAFAGRQNQLACWTEGGWRFAEPLHGMQVWNKAAGHFTIWTDAGWSAGTLFGERVNIQGKQVIGARLGAIPSPSGGSTVDTEARAAIASLTAALKTHGLTD